MKLDRLSPVCPKNLIIIANHFLQHLFYARTNTFTYINSYTPHQHTLDAIFSSIDEDTGTERLNNLPMVTKKKSQGMNSGKTGSRVCIINYSAVLSPIENEAG